MVRSGIYSYPHTQRIAYGTPFAQALELELKRVDCQRVYLLASGSLSRNTDAVQQVLNVLGPRCVGVFDQMPAHTPRHAVVRVRSAGARRLRLCIAAARR